MDVYLFIFYFRTAMMIPLPLEIRVIMDNANGVLLTGAENRGHNGSIFTVKFCITQTLLMNLSCGHGECAKGYGYRNIYYRNAFVSILIAKTLARL